MKKILTSFICCLSTFAYAETLECENHYPMLEEIIQQKSNAVRVSNEKEIHQFIEKYDYPYALREKFQNKRYWLNKNVSYSKSSWYKNQWISQNEYDKRIKIIAKENAKNTTNGYVHELLAPKANFMSAVGEICVVPVQAYIRIEADEGSETKEDNYLVVAMRIDHIFVRAQNQNAWRVVEFNRDISDQDFNGFFPHFPADIKNQLDDGVVEAQAQSVFEETEHM